MSTINRTELAARLGTSPKYIYQCLSGRKNMGALMALRVEQESGGAIGRQQLRRDWRQVWPELARREDARAKSRRKTAKPPAQGVRTWRRQ